MKYFKDCKTLEELKKAYRKLAMKYHPDMGGDPEVMKAINNEYDELFPRLKDQHNASADEYHQTTETAAEFVEIINQLIKLQGIEIELCGSWLWIGGETRQHKEALKAAGCKWCSKKGLWSWHHPEPGQSKKRHKGNSMEYIRDHFGSQIIKSDSSSSFHPVTV